MQVHVLATEEEAGLVPEGDSLAVTALGESKLHGLIRSCDAHGCLCVPLLELLRHDALVHDSIVVELGRTGLVLWDLLACDKGHQTGEGVSVLHLDGGS